VKAAVIIPARFGSRRFPGKAVMRDPEGKPLLRYVYDAAVRAPGVDRVIIATDDARIREVAGEFGADVRMTRPDHRCGSDRCAEVAAGLDHDVIVNLQGDEPAVRPEMVAAAIALIERDGACAVATLACPIRSGAELRDPNVVKVVLDDAGHALYFSRAPIPFVRDAAAPLAGSPAPHYHHVGIYAFRRPFLLEYASWGPHPLEEAEKLEQLRVLAHGYKIAVGVTPHGVLKVDTPQDFEAFVAEWRRRAAHSSPRET